jgi:hypothetical protein
MTIEKMLIGGDTGRAVAGVATMVTADQDADQPDQGRLASTFSTHIISVGASNWKR